MYVDAAPTTSGRTNESSTKAMTQNEFEQVRQAIARGDTPVIRIRPRFRVRRHVQRVVGLDTTWALHPLLIVEDGERVAVENCGLERPAA